MFISRLIKANLKRVNYLRYSYPPLLCATPFFLTYSAGLSEPVGRLYAVMFFFFGGFSWFLYMACSKNSKLFMDGKPDTLKRLQYEKWYRIFMFLVAGVFLFSVLLPLSRDVVLWKNGQNPIMREGQVISTRHRKAFVNERIKFSPTESYNLMFYLGPNIVNGTRVRIQVLQESGLVLSLERINAQRFIER